MNSRFVSFVGVVVGSVKSTKKTLQFILGKFLRSFPLGKLSLNYKQHLASGLDDIGDLLYSTFLDATASLFIHQPKLGSQATA